MSTDGWGDEPEYESIGPRPEALGSIELNIRQMIGGHVEVTLLGDPLLIRAVPGAVWSDWINKSMDQQGL